VKRALLAFVLALGACAAPASYDGLAGGTKEDAAVEAPRPISPISVSLIASSRPRLRWDLGRTLTGAVIEMARTREFSGEVKRFPAKGSELVVPEDLALGVWFWRLRGESAGAVGTATSVVWEMVVRGPAKNGSSDGPTRAMVDLNGDGEPDLLVGATVDDGAGPHDPGATVSPDPTAAPSGHMPIVFLFASDKERDLGDVTDYLTFGPSSYDGPIAIGAGTDLDGDGLGDVIESGTDAGSYEGHAYFGVTVTYAKLGKSPFDFERGGNLYLGPEPSVLPGVRESGDVDGDGFGDAVVGVRDTGFVVLGSHGGMAVPAILPVNPGAPSATSRAALGGFDANGDGLADVAFSINDSFTPKARAFVAAGSRTERLGDPRMIDAPDAARATAFAAGDYNGDGVDDVAMTTAVGDAARVCLWFGDRERLLAQGPCLTGPPGDADFGASLTAADLEGDGIDELLLTTREGGVDGVRVVRLGENGSASAFPVGPPGVGVRLTTLWPGRPGKARWAAVGSDGGRIAVFEGAELRTSIGPPPGVVGGFGRGLR
jgi:hypothetical protein